MQRVILACGLVFLCGTQLWATPNFSDNFEGGVSGAVWQPWPGTTPSQNLLISSNNHNHTPAGSLSALSPSSDPAAWNATHDFGAYSVPTGEVLRSSVYVWDDLSAVGSSTFPTRNMLALVGDTGGSPGFGTEYFQLGAVTGYGSNAGNTYSFRTRYNDQNSLGIIDTGIARKAGWTKLGIEVDSVSAGKQVRFYIDDILVGSSFRSGATPADLRWVRLGWNDKNYANFWYDDVSVTPEPAALSLLGLGALLLRRRRSIA